MVGIFWVSVLACAVLGGAFASMAQRRFGNAGRGPATAFAVTGPAVMMVSGMYPFLAGSAFAVLTLVAAQRCSRLGFALAATATVCFSPLAFLVLVLCLLAAVVEQHRPLAVLTANRVQAVFLVLLVGLAAVWARLFSSQGYYAYGGTDLVVIAVFSGLGLYLCGLREERSTLRAFFAVYLVANVLAFALSTPVGSNAARVFSIAGMPLLWMASRVGNHPRHRVVVAAILVAALSLQMTPVVIDAYAEAHDPAAAPSYWRPVIGFLDRHPSQAYRVEVVATWGHWEAYYLATRGIPLARGWYRQNDYPQNQVLYRGDELTARAYRAWLRTMGVRYVFLPGTRLDYSAVAEASLLRSGLSGLTELWHSRNWTLYQLPHPRAMLTPPAGDHARLLGITPAAVRMWLSDAGVYTLRVHYSPYWRVPAGACVGATADGMTAIRTLVAGPLTLHMDPSPDSLGDALLGPGSSC